MNANSYILDVDLKNSQKIHLAIEVSDKFISLAILDIFTNKCFGIETFSINIENDFLQQSKLLQQVSPKTVSCSYNTLSFTLIPNALFNEKELDTYAMFNFKLEDNSKLLYSSSIKENIITCFAINQKLYNYLFLKFPNLQLKHISSYLIDTVNLGVHINFSNFSTFECLFINKNGLLFYNGYQYASTEETLYYISLVCDKLQLDIKKVKFSISGITNDKITNLWQDYIPKGNLIYKTIFAPHSFSSKLSNLQKHKYYSLIKQHLCV